MIIVYNLIGAGILILAGGIGIGVGYLFHAKTETPAMVVAGLLALAFDVIYRMDKGEGSLSIQGEVVMCSSFRPGFLVWGCS